MKKIILLLCILFFTLLTVEAQQFPEGRTLYFSNNQGRVVSLKFYYDKDRDPVCSPSGTAVFYKWTGNNGGLAFSGFKYTPEQKPASYVPGGIAFNQYTGRVIKQERDETMWLASDYSRVTVNGTTYNKRITVQQFNAISQDRGYSGGGYNNIQGTSSGKIELEKMPARHGYTPCKDCSFGKCRYCKGDGIRETTQGRRICLVCNGTMKCQVCRGTGRIRY